MIALTFADARELGDGVWIAPLTPVEARRFGSNVTVKGRRSVVGVEGAKFDQTGKALSVSLDTIATLSIGQENEAIFLDLTVSSTRTNEILPTADQLAIDPKDQPFINACRSHLSSGMVDIATMVLGGVRKTQDFTLAEGVGRKWTASPNFLAITIQNRNQQFLVSVKANPAKASYRTIRLKRSRSPYAEFYLNSASQVEDAVKAMVASASYR